MVGQPQPGGEAPLGLREGEALAAGAVDPAAAEDGASWTERPS